MPNSRLECNDHTLLMIKMAKIDTLFMTQMAYKTIAFRAAHNYVADIREYPRVYSQLYINLYLVILFYFFGARWDVL